MTGEQESLAKAGTSVGGVQDEDHCYEPTRCPESLQGARGPCMSAGLHTSLSSCLLDVASPCVRTF